MKQLKIRFGLNQIANETYAVTQEHLNEQILQINKELNNGEVKISNLEKLLVESLKKLGNISRMWHSNDVEGKRITHKHCFLKEFSPCVHNRYLDV